MGLPDIPPPTTMCLKRCRSEDSSSLTELCSPTPKQACLASQGTHHLSLLAELESSLDASAIEAPTPEELVMEMMQSLERVMGDIGELVSVSGEGTNCVETLANSLQRHASSRDMASNYAESDLAEASCEGSPCVGTTGNIADAPQRLDSIRDVELGCGEYVPALRLDTYAREDLDVGGAVSELHSYITGDGSDAGGAGCYVGEDRNLCDFGERYTEEGGCDGGHVGLDNIQHLLDMSDDELGISQAGVGHTSSHEVKDEQWNLLDDFVAAVAGNDGVVGCNDGVVGCCGFLEEGYEFASFTLSQDEESTLARAREQDMLDCCF